MTVDLLSKKLDSMNAHQERRHGEICEKIESLERSTYVQVNFRYWRMSHGQSWRE